MRYLVIVATDELLGEPEGSYWVVDTQGSPKALLCRCASMAVATAIAAALNGP